jgi:putative ABC transport system permease protein
VRYLIRIEPGSSRAVLPAIEQRLLQENPGRTFEVKTILEVKDQYFAGGRIVVTMMTGLIVLLIAVTAIGILGIASFSVTERTRQIGTRRALGATRVDILRYFLLENWLITTAGLMIGVAAAYGLNILLVTQVSGVKLGWPLIMGGVLLLWFIGLAATLAPALRGSSLSPAVATRSV